MTDYTAILAVHLSPHAGCAIRRDAAGWPSTGPYHTHHCLALGLQSWRMARRRMYRVGEEEKQNAAHAWHYLAFPLLPQVSAAWQDCCATIYLTNLEI